MSEGLRGEEEVLFGPRTEFRCGGFLGLCVCVTDFEGKEEWERMETQDSEADASFSWNHNCHCHMCIYALVR